ncbi:PhzF family phenazine biosynthesis protein [Zhihengliuella flava]|uniref:PhzF superfamily epimerase YddE/YHI9 n=1 Tax=Zhihengliuella flava TaxID=1285193 RepID=A0A931DBB8_9MICC|nr:PhzF family phenazine biosynthesis protein [Zhihengliuella flava]MBG6084281.1 putative PhzF superfamily epimerase YddE/YHI9 [Zhihengliuella flava]
MLASAPNQDSPYARVHFKQVDVFSAVPYLGNALAVVLDATHLDTETMQRIAQWTNLSETTFVLPPTTAGADYRVRIFTSTTELPFAGHPTLGTAHAWLEAGGVPAAGDVVVQECEAGLIEVRIEDPDAAAPRLALKAPQFYRTGPLEDDVLEWAVTGLGLRMDDVVGHQWLANGPQWAGLLLRDAETVLRIEPDFASLEGLEVGVIGPHLETPSGNIHTGRDPRHEAARPSGTRAELEPLPDTGAISMGAFASAISHVPADYEVRAFCPGEALPEDPVTGSLNAGFARWLVTENLAAPSFTVRQGTRVGRAGYVQVHQDEAGLWIAGDCLTCIDGSVLVP